MLLLNVCKSLFQNLIDFPKVKPHFNALRKLLKRSKAFSDKLLLTFDLFIYLLQLLEVLKKDDRCSHFQSRGFLTHSPAEH